MALDIRYGANPLALILGAGAVENAWAPILRAVQPYYDFPITGDGVNSFMARLVYLLRWYACTDDTVALEKHKQFLGTVRERICEEVSAAQSVGELSVRASFAPIVERFLVSRSRTFMLINTNWDEVVDRASASYLDPGFRVSLCPLHIHGSLARHRTIYLPTEVTRKPYRTPEEDTEIGTIHGDIMRGLESATHAVVYGLSLSPLDPELCQTLAAGWDNPAIKQIDVVVPDHELVANRVNMLLHPRISVIVMGYHHGRLDDPIDYTIQRKR